MTKALAGTARGLMRGAGISNRLHQVRELACCGDSDLLPTERYLAAASRRAARDAAWTVRLVQRGLAVVGKPGKRLR